MVPARPQYVRILAALGLGIATLTGCAAGPDVSPNGLAGLGPDDCGTQPVGRIDAVLAASSSSPAPEPNRHAAPELEALLPRTIAGVQFGVQSFRWEAGSPDTLTPLLGKRPENVCYALATSVDPSKLAAGIQVYRIVGVAGVEFRNAMIRSSFGLNDPPDEQTVGGKQVVVVQMIGSPMVCCSDGPVYLYATGEALFGVTPADAEVAATVLGALP
jgi:hypothetical protein